MSFFLDQEVKGITQKKITVVRIIKDLMALEEYYVQSFIFG
jgi:hypothetical protein